MDLETPFNSNDVYDEGHTRTSMIVGTLSAMKVRFEKGHKILQKYDQLGIPRPQQYQASGLTILKNTVKWIAWRLRLPQLR